MSTKRGTVKSGALFLPIALLVASCAGSGGGTAFEERALVEPEWLTTVKDEICTAKQGDLGGFEDSGASGSILEGDAPCYLTSDVAGGGAIFDFTGDQLPDIVYTTAQLGEPVFLENLGNWRFADVSARITPDSAPGTLKGANGVAVGDIDNDGDPDLFFTVFGRTSSVLLVNQGNGTFLDETEARGAGMVSGSPHFGASAVFGDYDGDGWLDLHTNEFRALEIVERSSTGHARLLRNLGGEGRPGHFEDVTNAAGVNVRLPMGAMYAFVSAFHDYNADGLLDLHVVSDFNTSRIFLNNGDGTFRDGFDEMPITADESGMGIALGDVTGDGVVDVFVAAASQHPPPPMTDLTCPDIDAELHRYGRDGTTGNRLFDLSRDVPLDITDKFGVRHSGWGWGAVMADFGNEGRLGIVTVASFNVIFNALKLYCLYEGTTQPVIRIWENDGAYMKEISAGAGVLGEGRPKSPLTADLDGDGDEDLVVFNSGAAPRLFENTTPGADSRYVRIRFGGSEHPVGARITITFSDGSRDLVRYAGMQNGLMSARFTDEVVGLGERAGQVAGVRVEYRSGTVFKAADLSSGSIVVAP